MIEKKNPWLFSQGFFDFKDFVDALSYQYRN